MPNWKKIIVSGSDASLSSAYIEGNLTASAAYLTSASIGHLETIYETASVIYSSGSTKFGDTLDDTHEITGSLLVSSSITSISASIDNLTANDKLQLGGAGSQFFAFNEDTIKVKFANWYSSNDRQYGMGQLWYETWFAAIDNQAGRDNRRIGFYLEEPDAGSTDSGTPGQHPSNARFYVDINGAYLSGSLNVEQSITGSEISASLIGTASIADFATTASHVLPGSTNSGSFSGSFEGDGSNLTGISVSPFPFTGSASISGTLAVTKSQTGYVDDYANNYFGIGTVISTNGDVVADRFVGVLSGSIEEAVTADTASFVELAKSASLSLALSNLATASIANSSTTASHAVTLSQLATASIANRATTASFTETGDGTFSGSFSGSFQGDGSDLVGVIANPSPFSGSFDITGSLRVTGSLIATSVTETSALKYKESVETLNSSDIVSKLRPVSFKWKDTKKTDIGLIAEEVNQIIPELVDKNPDGESQGIKYSKITALLIKSIQDLTTQNSELISRIKDLENKILD